MEPVEIRWVGPYAGSRNRHLHLIRKAGPTPDGLPRRPGIAKKRPLGPTGTAAKVAAECALICFRRIQLPETLELAVLLTASGRPMGTVYAIANQKGGVGKTTTAVNLAACVAAAGEQTLLVDLDPQCNATVALGVDRDLSPVFVRLPERHRSSPSARARRGRTTSGWCPASRDLAGAAVELPRVDDSETRLRDTLGPVRERFAATLLDCPPSLGPVTVNALVAADRVIVPVQAEYLALEGLVQFIETLELVRRGLNPAPRSDRRRASPWPMSERRLSRDVERELREHFGGLVFETVIPRSVRIAEAPSYGVAVGRQRHGSKRRARLRPAHRRARRESRRRDRNRCRAPAARRGEDGGGVRAELTLCQLPDLRYLR